MSFSQSCRPAETPSGGTPLRGDIVNQSDGTTTVRLICDERYHSFATAVERLRRLPNVRNIKVRRG